jgi:hypothetical protein
VHATTACEKRESNPIESSGRVVSGPLESGHHSLFRTDQSFSWTMWHRLVTFNPSIVIVISLFEEDAKHTTHACNPTLNANDMKAQDKIQIDIHVKVSQMLDGRATFLHGRQQLDGT